jgi:hypothetical protein
LRVDRARLSQQLDLLGVRMLWLCLFDDGVAFSLDVAIICSPIGAPLSAQRRSVTAVSSMRQGKVCRGEPAICEQQLTEAREQYPEAVGHTADILLGRIHELLTRLALLQQLERETAARTPEGVA